MSNTRAQNLKQWLEELRQLCECLIFSTEDEPQAVAAAMVQKLATHVAEQATFIYQQFPAVTEHGLFSTLQCCLEDLLLTAADVVDTRGSRMGTLERRAFNRSWSACVDLTLRENYLRFVAAIDELNSAAQGP